VEFTDLLYQAERQQGVPNQAGQEAIPEGAMLGLGVAMLLAMTSRLSCWADMPVAATASALICV
jgi:flagellar basal body rod protein FlgG